MRLAVHAGPAPRTTCLPTEAHAARGRAVAPIVPITFFSKAPSADRFTGVSTGRAIFRYGPGRSNLRSIEARVRQPAKSERKEQLWRAVAQNSRRIRWPMRFHRGPTKPTNLETA